MCSPGYSLLNEITNVKSFIKDNMKKRESDRGIGQDEGLRRNVYG